jgi:hypothetical protein
VTGQTIWWSGPRAVLIVGDRAVLRAHHLRQGVARHRDQPQWRAPDGHPARARRQALLRAGGADRRLSGILIAPITTVYYDTGFLIGLKGFVGAIIGGLASYPLAAFGAVLVGLLESFASFWASAFKEVLVFTLIIPVLLVALADQPATWRKRNE